jgi:FKBP-type peptidyl-prolyl cis-trans isomerase FklB
MKSFIIALATLTLIIPASGQDKPQTKPQDKPPEFKDLKDKFSYSIGLQFGFNFKRQNVDLNIDTFMAGLRDALANKPRMTESEVRETMTAWTKETTEKQKVVADKNAAESEKFLVENKKKEGVKTTASGLQYKVIKEGTGAQPKETETVTVHYRGTLTDGTEFDSSHKRGEPATFPVNGVIKGWQEALQMMKTGSKYQLFVPPSLAYAERATGSIPPNSVLIFEVELLGIKPPAATPAAPAAPASPGSAASPSPSPTPAASPTPKK